mmetsp:Transcript_13365/g.40517  ORF Transcript_13365/g.40517 Transcript_13365/m.40517 type:complete len:136 (-) Transcript_13365:1235-1642(-)
MVLIVDGEILQDNDPRAIAARQRRGGPSAPSPARGAAARPASRSPPPPAAGAPASPLDQLAELIGIRGQSLTIPAIWRIPSREVPLIWLVLLGVGTMFGGWRLLAAAALLHVFSGLSDNSGAPALGGGVPTTGRR